MQITVTFSSFDELTSFADLLSGKTPKQAMPAAQTPAVDQQAVPTAPKQAMPAAQTGVPTVPQQAVPTAAPTLPFAPATPATSATQPAQVPQLATTSQPAQVPQAVPTSAREYTIDELSVAAMQLMDMGKQPELVALLQTYGVPSLPALPKGAYGAFATALREMGAKI